MYRILILGCTGMLGSTILKVFASRSGLKTLGTTRDGSIIHGNRTIALDVAKEDINDFLKTQEKFDFIINCVGLISHKILESDSSSVKNAIDLNAILPYKLALISEKSKTKVIQITTDCVFSGKLGPYFEDSEHFPSDIYGITKSAGEVNSDNVLNLRCSIVGKEIASSYSLMNWILNHSGSKKIDGFINHKWNGITTQAYGKILLGIIEKENFFSGLQHIVPRDYVTKFELLNQFNKLGRQSQLQINEYISIHPIDRRLGTRYPQRNLQLWEDGGFPEIPTIQTMLEEYFDFEFGGNNEFQN